ncbi:MAG: hypothetical protein JWQ90_4948 [Hydrocarboniphaga sp.]|uniref:glycosyltransferase family 2 protein n=1 Tax=Hydrocarboniphaga sp. TaxID=2033016 RepID=UPI002627943C|nr:glycosyltransferase family 2 protein [Hydrocarboniphaga sp.]MDB5972498.1 hypothetical protein [Hydrocarboniphaga sp.]
MSSWLNRILRRKPPPVRYRGHLDALRDFVADGWAIDFQAPERPVIVELLVDGVAVVETLADRPRADLKQALIGNGFHGFVVALPEAAFDGRHHAISARIKDTGHLLVGSWDTVLLNPEWRAGYDGAVTGVEEGAVLRGYCRSLGADPAPLIIDLMLDGVRIAQATASGAAPINELADGCGFGFDLAKLGRPDLLSATLECRIAGTTVAFPASAAVHRAIALENLRLLDGALVGTIPMPPFLPVDTAIDLLLDSAPVDDVTWTSAPGRHGIVLRQFRVPLSAQQQEAAAALSFEARLRDLGYQLGRPRHTVQEAPKNLLANALFQQWQGKCPASWQLTQTRLLRCLPEHCLLDLADAELPWFGPLALRLDLAQPGDELAAAPAPVTLLSQTLGIDSLPSAQPLDFVLVARADKPARAELVLEIEDIDGSRAEVRAPLQLLPRWSHQATRLSLPARAATSRSALLKARLKIDVLDDVGVVHFAAAGLGLEGFEWKPAMSPVPDDVADGVRPDPNAVTNGSFRDWSHGLEFENPGRRLETADRWFLRSDSTPAALTIVLEKIALQDGSRNQPPRELYGLGMLGESRSVIRMETPLDPLSLRMGAPEILRFYAARKPHRDTAAAAPIERIALIQRSRRPGSPGVPVASHDEILCTIARRVIPSQAGRYHQFKLPRLNIDWSALSTRFDLATADQGTVLLAFEFAGEIDCVLADVFLGTQQSSVAAVREAGHGREKISDSREAGYIGLEDPNIINQLDLIKGLAAWGRGEPITLAAGAAETGDVETGAAASGVRWSLPHLNFPSVEIVIPVYNAPQDVLNCLRSIERNTGVPHLLTLVDDASDAETEQQLLRYARGRPWVKVIRNDANLGYTRTSNIGLAQSAAQWVLLLNSDTLATPGWLEGLVECALSDPAIKLVGALSNAASWQSVPELFDSRGKFKINALPDGWSADDVAALVRRESARAFPRVPLLNGFCTMIERDALERLGYLDEIAFPVGYGEENDLCLRAVKAGYQLAIADHVYVYHVKSASFGNERRDLLSKQGQEQLMRKHPDVDLKREQQKLMDLPALVELRSALVERLSGLPMPAHPERA